MISELITESIPRTQYGVKVGNKFRNVELSAGLLRKVFLELLFQVSNQIFSFNMNVWRHQMSRKESDFVHTRIWNFARYCSSKIKKFGFCISVNKVFRFKKDCKRFVSALRIFGLLMRNVTIKCKVSKACSNPKFVGKVFADYAIWLTAKVFFIKAFNLD